METRELSGDVVCSALGVIHHHVMAAHVEFHCLIEQVLLTLVNNGKPGTVHGITYEQCIHRLVVLFLLDLTGNADVEGTLEPNIVFNNPEWNS